MRNEENIDHIIRDQHVITSLSLICKITTVCDSFITIGSEKRIRRELYFLINN